MADDQLQNANGASQTIPNTSQPASEQAPSEAPADPVSIPESASIDPNRPVSTILADSATDYTVPVLADSPAPPADVSTEVSAKVDPISVAPPPVDPSVPSSPSSPSELASGGSIQDSSPPNEPSQVQPEVPVSAPSPQAAPAPETAPQSAEIKAEAPQGTQPAPLADLNSQKSSFGDILIGTGETITPPVEEPTITIEPIGPPKPVQTQPSPQPPTEVVVEAKADFSAKRQQALQTRRKKRDDHLAKILTLISQKDKIKNNDVCDLFRVSQSTATNYLHSLVKDGKIKKEGKAKATIYSL